MFKKFISKDKLFRKQYSKFEIWNLLNKSLKKSLNVYNIYKPLVNKKPIKYSKVFIRNYCFETGRSSGVVPFFRISRMLLKKKAGIGLLIGVYKD